MGPWEWDCGDRAMGMGPWGQVPCGWRWCPHALRQPGVAVVSPSPAPAWGGHATQTWHVGGSDAAVYPGLSQLPWGPSPCPFPWVPVSPQGRPGDSPCTLPPMAAAPTQPLSPSPFQPKSSASLVSPRCQLPTPSSPDTPGGPGRLVSPVTPQAPRPASSYRTPPGRRCSCWRR